MQTIKLGLTSPKDEAKVVPIQYDAECPFKYNNFVYRISLASPIASNQDGPTQPGCVAIPKDTKELILRLTNPDAEGMSLQTRVENEVANIYLASAALSDITPHVVPSVYAWGSAAGEPSQGWIFQELMPGTPLDEAFGAMDITQKQQIFTQMAKMLKALHDYKLPDSITGFGGLTLDDAGHIISSVMPSVGAGPWPSYEASFKAMFESLSSKDEKSILHCDFTTNNILFDASSGRITALIDYDFSCVLHRSYEFLRSLDNAGGQFCGWSGDDDSEQMALRGAKLHGFPSPLPQSTKDGVQWEVAKAWECELEKLGVERPRTIDGIDKVADVDAVLRGILPWRLSNSDIVRLQSEEVKLGHREKCEKELRNMLVRLGF
ncbi:conserved hypothetical protein [Microsporum canis CBS 113480]|uniref:Aminoglycoside phosphotransferase domain-containing protein n=1 Tax=Arthroderma otae (strain ATCC MYA-4605 / CBS 113480) TaxID=554155 RepID=C5FE41_ARTOC|nr:conserved hypothetical protein [Microsporum canis CBS 113480]EEQ28075.1 conserved hypothetical protein [Microsporum canis CBS 113480]